MPEARNQALLAYVPIDRRHALARGTTLPVEVRGAAVEADLSGFTALTESLARRLGEHHGAEELARWLDLLFDGLVAAVHEFRGTVLAFSGDAMTCWFDGDDGHRAVAAALRMQDWVVECQDGEPVVRLKVAVAVGDTRRFLVGDPEHQMLEGLAGALVDELAATEHTAEPDDIVLAPSALTALGDSIRWTGRDGVGVLDALETPVEPAPWPKLPAALDDEAVRPWLLPAVFERLRSGHGDFLAELRPANAMFVRFLGIDFEHDPAAVDRLNAFVRDVLAVIGRYDGTLLQLTIGDKGSYLYAVFGAPVAHEDDATRAVFAAAGVSALEEAAGLEISIGVTSGRLRAGAYGGSARKTYGVLGDAVNLSARLMQAAAAGEVIATRDIAEAAGAAFGWEPLEPLTVKGKSEPVDVLRLAGVQAGQMRRRTRAHDSALLGRREELAALEERLRLATSGRGQIVGIAAEAGMGKSRLIHELLRRPDSPRRLEGVCQSYDATGSFGVWRPVWQAILGEDQASASGALERLDPLLLPRLPLLSAVLDAAIEDNDLTRPFDAKLRKESLEAMLVDVLRAAAAEEPLVLVLDDIHWIDPLSEDLLLAVGRAVHALPVLVLLAYRSRSATEGGPPVVADLPYFTELALTELDHEDVARLVELRLEETGGEREAVAAVAGAVAERAQGNPFYVEELLAFLTDRGGTLPTAEELAQIELPGSLHSLILSRLDRLAERPRATAKVASVVGRSFAAPILPAVHPELGDDPAVDASLGELREHEFVVLESEELRAYEFRHVVTQEVAYGSIPGTIRATLHGRIGRRLEDEGADLDVLAHHFWLGDDDDRKRDYLVRAGAAAQARYANAAAITYYRRALPLLGPTERSDVLLRLGKVLELTGEWGEAHETYRSALQVAGERGDGSGRAWAETSLGEVSRKQGLFEEALLWFHEARAGFEQLGDLAGAGQVLHYAGTLAAQQGDYEEARRGYTQSLELRRQLADTANMASLLSNLGVVAEYEGDYEDARRFNEQALALRRALGDRWAIAVSLNNLGNIALLQGRPDEARALVEEAVAAHREAGDTAMIASSLDNLGNALRELGAHAEAKALYDESLALALRLGDLWLAAYVLEDLAMLLARVDREAEALTLAGAAARVRREIGAPRPPASQEELDRALERARTTLGAAAGSAFSEGETLDAAAAAERAAASFL